MRQKPAAADSSHPGPHSLAEIHGTALAAILNSNRQHPIRQNMVDKGHTHEQAEAEIDVLLAIVRYVGQVRLEVGDRRAGTGARMQVELNLP